MNADLSGLLIGSIFQDLEVLHCLAVVWLRVQLVLLAAHLVLAQTLLLELGLLMVVLHCLAQHLHRVHQDLQGRVYIIQICVHLPLWPSG